MKLVSPTDKVIRLMQRFPAMVASLAITREIITLTWYVPGIYSNEEVVVSYQSICRLVSFVIDRHMVYLGYESRYHGGRDE